MGEGQPMSEALNTTALNAAVDQLSALLSADGGSLSVTGIDQAKRSVALRLDLESVECAECVLPPERLFDVVSRTISAAVPEVASVALYDWRTQVPSAAVPRLVTVLDPTSDRVHGNRDPGPDVGPLAGKRVGLRVDVLWAAYDQTVDEWIPLLKRCGATVSTWRRAQGLKGREGQEHQAEYDAFVGSVDVIISGLANCGSCTSWSVKDGLNALNRGLPAVVAVTEHFVDLARTLATDAGRPGLRLLPLDPSLNVLDEQRVRASARAAFPRLLESLGATAR
jgi:Fe-S cluster biogenesis protein NfuA